MFELSCRLKFLFVSVTLILLTVSMWPVPAYATAEVSAQSSAAAVSHAVSAPHAVYTVSPLMILPFVLLLLAIAVMPFINKHFWENNYHLISYALGAFVVLYYIFSLGAAHKVLDTLHEYISFIALIGSLFVVTGGIVIKLKNEGNPVINASILFIGAIIANIIGTTGASMLLIRPFIRINHKRIRPYLVVFFIFIVSNIGGALTPIGDPPLFLGYLQGVPFFWVIENVISMWSVAMLLTLGVFFAIDYYHYSQDKFKALSKLVHAVSSDETGEERAAAVSREEKRPGVSSGDAADGVNTVTAAVKPHLKEVADEVEDGPAGKNSSKNKKKHKKHDAEEDGILSDEDETIKLKLYGITNFFFLFVILVSVFMPSPWRELVMLGCAAGAYRTTPAKNHVENGFNFDPIKEVAILFIGIFATMMPALDWLEANAAVLGVTTPAHFYWGSGLLSSFLDNAPTYLNFLSAAKGLNGVASVTGLLADPALAKFVIAISLGSVFFGANTYIGNGPNFMVKNIAEQMKVEMPSFFGYIFCYSLPVLIPIFAIVWAVFLR